MDWFWYYWGKMMDNLRYAWNNPFGWLFTWEAFVLILVIAVAWVCLWLILGYAPRG